MKPGFLQLRASRRRPRIVEYARQHLRRLDLVARDLEHGWSETAEHADGLAFALLRARAEAYQSLIRGFPPSRPASWRGRTVKR